jgi:hypothetical protein
MLLREEAQEKRKVAISIVCTLELLPLPPNFCLLFPFKKVSSYRQHDPASAQAETSKVARKHAPSPRAVLPWEELLSFSEDD